MCSGRAGAEGLRQLRTEELTCWDWQIARPRPPEVTGLSPGLCADGDTQPSCTWHFYLQTGTEARRPGFPRLLVQ